MSFYKLDTKRVKQLVRHYEKGHSMEQCAIDFGCNYSQVYSLLRGRTAIRPQGRPENKALNDLILADYLKGDKLRDIAARYGTHCCTVSNLAQKHGLPRRTQGRKLGDGVICNLSPEQYALHIEKRYPGITDLLGDTTITLESIGRKFGITRERIRQFERRIGAQKRWPIRVEAGKINAKRRELARQEHWKARGTRWKRIGGEVALLIESGCSREELVAALPWKMNEGKTPLNQRISQRLYHLRKISGVDIPRPHFFFKGGRPVTTKW